MQSRLLRGPAARIVSGFHCVRFAPGELSSRRETLATYLSPSAASSLKAPVLPTKLLHVSSALVGKGYTAAGKAGACLHTMAVLQAYQADLLKEQDGREQPQPCTSSSYREIQRQSIASRAPPQWDRGRQHPKNSRPSGTKPDLKVVLQSRKSSMKQS